MEHQEIIDLTIEEDERTVYEGSDDGDETADPAVDPTMVPPVVEAAVVEEDEFDEEELRNEPWRYAVGTIHGTDHWLRFVLLEYLMAHASDAAYKFNRAYELSRLTIEFDPMYTMTHWLAFFDGDGYHWVSSDGITSLNLDNLN